MSVRFITGNLAADPTGTVRYSEVHY